MRKKVEKKLMGSFIICIISRFALLTHTHGLHRILTVKIWGSCSSAMREEDLTSTLHSTQSSLDVVHSLLTQGAPVSLSVAQIEDYLCHR